MVYLVVEVQVEVVYLAVEVQVAVDQVPVEVQVAVVYLAVEVQVEVGVYRTGVRQVLSPERGEVHRIGVRGCQGLEVLCPFVAAGKSPADTCTGKHLQGVLLNYCGWEISSRSIHATSRLMTHTR